MPQTARRIAGAHRPKHLFRPLQHREASFDAFHFFRQLLDRLEEFFHIVLLLLIGGSVRKAATVTIDLTLQAHVTLLANSRGSSTGAGKVSMYLWSQQVCACRWTPLSALTA